MYKDDGLPPFVYFPRVFWSMNRVFRITTTYILFSGTRWKPCCACIKHPWQLWRKPLCLTSLWATFLLKRKNTKIFTFLLMYIQAHWILMSSSSRLVLEVRSHIIMSGNFTLLLGFSYAFSAKKKLKTWCVCVNIFNFFSYI